MKNTELLPYFHPTQAVLVDADIDYLGSLSLHLDADLAYLLFDRADRALAFINERAGARASLQRFFSVDDGDNAAIEHGGNRLHLNFHALGREMHFTDRFAQTSVVLVAENLPGMSGLTLCERIRDPSVKKILFADAVNETDAIDAFNRGIIDRFITKSQPRAYATLNDTIRGLQGEHIRDMFMAADDIFGLETPDLLSDPAVIDLMTMLGSRYDVVEYYLACRPWGFLLVDGDGDVHRLVLCDRHDRDEQIAWAKTHDVPDECLDRLAAGEIVFDPAIIGGDKPVHADVFRYWPDYSHAATRLAGQRDYIWTVFDHAAEQSRIARAASYNHYLEWVDALGYSMM